MAKTTERQEPEDQAQNQHQQNTPDQGYHDDFNPLTAEAVKDRAYTKPSTSANERTITEEIPEPQFAPPSLEEMERAHAKSMAEDSSDTPPSQNGVEAEQPKQEAPPQRAFNPKMEELPKSDQNRATEVAVDAVLDGYGQLKGAAANLAKLPKKKYEKLVKEGKIDPSQLIPYRQDRITGEWEHCTIEAFRTAYDAQAKEAIQMDPEFREKVRPVMIRVFQKRGIGMTDEQFLLYMFGQDVAITGYSVVKLSRDANQLLKQLEATSTGQSKPPSQEEYRESQSQSQPEPEPEKPKRTLTKEELEQELAKADSAEDEDFIPKSKQPEPEPAPTADTEVEAMRSTSQGPTFGDKELMEFVEKAVEEDTKAEQKAKKKKPKK